MSGIENEILSDFNDSAEAWAKSGARGGPYPITGVSTHVSLGVQVESGTFRVGKTDELDGITFINTLWSVNGHEEPCEWTFRPITLPRDMDGFLKDPRYPERRKRAVYAQLGEIKGFLTRVLGTDPGGIGEGVRKLNERIAGGARIGIEMEHVVKEVQNDQGQTATYHNFYVQGTFDASDMDLPADIFADEQLPLFQ